MWQGLELHASGSCWQYEPQNPLTQSQECESPVLRQLPPFLQRPDTEVPWLLAAISHDTFLTSHTLPVQPLGQEQKKEGPFCEHRAPFSQGLLEHQSTIWSHFCPV